MSASYEFTIWYPELKATALIRRLKTEGTTVENELEKALESLFEQYIPEPDRTSILAALLEADARQAEEDAQRKAEALRITAVQIILDGKFVCWKLNRDTSTEISLLSISRYLRTSLKQKDCPAAEAFLKCLGLVKRSIQNFSTTCYWKKCGHASRCAPYASSTLITRLLRLHSPRTRDCSAIFGI